MNLQRGSASVNSKSTVDVRGDALDLVHIFFTPSLHSLTARRAQDAIDVRKNGVEKTPWCDRIDADACHCTAELRRGTVGEGAEYLDRVRGHGPYDLAADEFYGYYTLDVKKDGMVLGMISVNAFSGQVWYHTWHGGFIGMQEGAATM